MNQMPDDELILLWQQGTSAEPNAEEVARLAARASMKRFDWIISRRNYREYAVSAVMLILFVSNFFHGDDRVLQAMALAMTCFYVGCGYFTPGDVGFAGAARFFEKNGSRFRSSRSANWFELPPSNSS